MARRHKLTNGGHTSGGTQEPEGAIRLRDKKRAVAQEQKEERGGEEVKIEDLT